MSMSCCKVGHRLLQIPVVLASCSSLRQKTQTQLWMRSDLLGPTVGAKCYRRLTLVRSSISDLFPLESVLSLLIALGRGSVETKGVLPIDHTTTIKSVRAY